MKVSHSSKVFREGQELLHTGHKNKPKNQNDPCERTPEAL